MRLGFEVQLNCILATGEGLVLERQLFLNQFGIKNVPWLAVAIKQMYLINWRSANRHRHINESKLIGKL